MAKVNGRSVQDRSRLCETCGARLKTPDDQTTCPNIERKDHKGQAYHGRA